MSSFMECRHCDVEYVSIFSEPVCDDCLDELI